MEYGDFRTLMNHHVIKGDRVSLLTAMAESPERFVGLFRPSTAEEKVRQYLTQSHEIRFGGALEAVIEIYLQESGYTPLTKRLTGKYGDALELDQHFEDGRMFYFVEQKTRDDHDSSKKRGQLQNFEKKLETLVEEHEGNLKCTMFFVDERFHKNRNYYQSELTRLARMYDVPIDLMYGREFFTQYMNQSCWDELTASLRRWKGELGGMQLDCDCELPTILEELIIVEAKVWGKLIDCDDLWTEGVAQILSSKGETFNALAAKLIAGYPRLGSGLLDRVSRHY